LIGNHGISRKLIRKCEVEVSGYAYGIGCGQSQIQEDQRSAATILGSTHDPPDHCVSVRRTNNRGMRSLKKIEILEAAGIAFGGEVMSARAFES
jgi:hypothetical protein